MDASVQPEESSESLRTLMDTTHRFVFALALFFAVFGLVLFAGFFAALVFVAFFLTAAAFLTVLCTVLGPAVSLGPFHLLLDVVRVPAAAGIEPTSPLPVRRACRVARALGDDPDPDVALRSASGLLCFQLSSA
jgi:hypothetical protein